jgi:hypothetical protein
MKPRVLWGLALWCTFSAAAPVFAQTTTVLFGSVKQQVGGGGLHIALIPLPAWSSAYLSPHLWPKGPPQCNVTGGFVRCWAIPDTEEIRRVGG